MPWQWICDIVQKINLDEKFAAFDTVWDPKVIAAVNDQHVKLARLRGEFVWHRHENEDELFFVVDGQLTIEFRDRSVSLGPGDMLVVPRSVEHRPVAHGEVKLLLIEPASTRNTGNVENELTVAEPEWI